MNLKTRCRIERPVADIDPVYGSPTETWQVVAHAWCELQDVLPSRDQSVSNSLTLQSIRTRVRMRWRSDIDGTMRIIVMRPNETIMTIVGGPAEIGNKDGVEFLCERKSS